MHYIDQYLEKLKVFSVCSHVESFLCIRKFPPKKCGAELVTVTNQPVARPPPTCYAYSHAIHFFSSTSWKYHWLPIWLKFLNLKRNPVKYQYWEGYEVVCTCDTGMSQNAKKLKFLHSFVLLAKLKFRNYIVKFLLVRPNQLTVLHPPLTVLILVY